MYPGQELDEGEVSVVEMIVLRDQPKSHGAWTWIPD